MAIFKTKNLVLRTKKLTGESTIEVNVISGRIISVRRDCQSHPTLLCLVLFAGSDILYEAMGGMRWICG